MEKKDNEPILSKDLKDLYCNGEISLSQGLEMMYEKKDLTYSKKPIKLSNAISKISSPNLSYSNDNIYKKLIEFLTHIISDKFFLHYIGHLFDYYNKKKANRAEDVYKGIGFYIRNPFLFDDKEEQVKLLHIDRDLLLKRCVFTNYVLWCTILKRIFNKTNKEVNDENYENSLKNKNQKREFIRHLQNAKTYTFYKINLGGAHAFCLIKTPKNLIIVDSYYHVRKTRINYTTIKKLIDLINQTCYNGNIDYYDKPFFNINKPEEYRIFDSVFKTNGALEEMFNGYNRDRPLKDGTIMPKWYLYFVAITIDPEELNIQLSTDKAFKSTPSIVKNSKEYSKISMARGIKRTKPKKRKSKKRKSKKRKSKKRKSKKRKSKKRKSKKKIIKKEKKI